MVWVRKLNPAEPARLDYIFDVTTTVADTNTLFTVFSTGVTIFQSIVITSMCREFCY